MIVKWLTDTRGAAIIDRIECTRETDRAVWYTVCDDFEAPEKEVKSPKVSRYVMFHDTWQEAHAYLREHAEVMCIVSGRELARDVLFAKGVDALKPPATEEKT